MLPPNQHFIEIRIPAGTSFEAAGHGDHVTGDRLDARMADVLAAIAASETRTVLRIAAAAGAVIVATRFLAD